MIILFNILKIFSLIIFLICIFFTIYKLIKNGKQSISANYFLCIIISILTFAISLQGEKLYFKNSIINMEIENDLNYSERNFNKEEELQKMMTTADLTREQAESIMKFIQDLGFNEFYFEGSCHALDDEQFKGYSLVYKDKKFYMTISNDKKPDTLFSGSCYFYNHGKYTSRTCEDWYISKDEISELKNLTQEALETYVKKDFSDTTDWRITKTHVSNDRGFLITSLKDNFTVRFNLSKALTEIVLDSQFYYPVPKYIMTESN